MRHSKGRPEVRPTEESLSPALEDYLALAAAGTAPPREEFLARHPELAEDLDACLAALHFIGRAAARPRSGAADFAEALPPEQATGQLGDFRLIREVGRGGMGVVYEAEQISLGRRVALKVLPFAATMDQRQIQRFHNEARAAALLDHPHIVHVHAVGCERAVHFYAMQFIEGQTLAAMIAALRQPSRPAGAAVELTMTHVAKPLAPAADTAARATASTERAPRDRAHFRRVAELGIQAAEALEHAHTLGIVHRDVKPANLLVDGRGALWVTDFGLAHVQSDARLTMTGDLVGTLRYMSPEQALANRAVVDHRTDVYSLGATLYELLTLEPAYRGDDRQELLRQIAFEEPRPPRRLNRAVPAELATIVLKAMEKNPGERYATAQELADDLRRFLDCQPVRAKAPTLQQRATKWARRNRPAVVTAGVAALFVAAVLGAAGGVWYQREQARETREAEMLLTRQEQFATDLTRLLDEAQHQSDDIRDKLGDPVKASQLVSRIDGWRDSLAGARAALRQAERLAEVDEALLPAELSQRLYELTKGLARDEEDWRLAKDLDNARLSSAALDNGIWNPGSIDPTYARLFRNLGINVDDRSASAHAQIIERARLRYVLVAALDYWSIVTNTPSRAGTLTTTARLADSDSWRDQVRTESNWTKPAVLNDLAQKADLGRHSPQVIQLLAKRLKDNKIDAVPLLRASLLHHPQDFWLHVEIAEAIPNWNDRIGHYFAALSVRNDSSAMHNSLALCLREVGDMDGAVRHFRKAIESDPLHIISQAALSSTLFMLHDLDGADRHFHIASDLANKNASTSDLPQTHAFLHAYVGFVGQGQKKDLELILRHLRTALQLDPNCVMAHNVLGNIRRAKGDPDGAITEYREALRLDKNFAEIHSNLGNALVDKGELDEAITEYREAIRLKEHLPMAHNNLGNALSAKGDLDGAVSAYREAIRLNKSYALAHNNLGVTLHDKGDLEEAIKEYREAMRLNKGFAYPHHNLGNALRARGDLEGAITEYREAIRLQKNYMQAYRGLGNALRSKGELDGAITAYRDALRLSKDDAKAHCSLGHVLRDVGHFTEALACLRRAHELGTRKPGWHYPTAQWLKECEQLVELDARLVRILKGEIQPADAGERLKLARLCQLPGKALYASATHLFRAAFVEQPKLESDLQAQHRYDAASAAALAGTSNDTKESVPEADKSALRRQARDWLQADLDAYTQQLKGGREALILQMTQRLAHWRVDPDFDGVRAEQALAKLPEAEHTEWRKLWGDVNHLLGQTRSGQAPSLVTDITLEGSLTNKLRKAVYELKLEAGKTYAFDMKCKELDSYLKLYDPAGKLVAENDDIAPNNLDARVIFTPTTSGVHRITATSVEQSGRGAYTLTIRAVSK